VQLGKVVAHIDFLFAAALIAGAAAIFLINKQKEKILSNDRSGSQGKAGQNKILPMRQKKTLQSAQHFIGFQDIKNGIIILPNNEYRLIVEVVGTVNFYLLSEEEQEKIEAYFRSLLRSLSFPVQFYIQTRLLDLDEEVRYMTGKLAELPPQLQEYGMSLADSLMRWTGAKNVMIKKSYIVIPYNNSDFNEAVRELYRRRDIVVAELSKWIECRTLSSLEAAEVLYIFYNKEKAVTMKISDAEQYGFTESYVRGVGIGNLRESFEETTEYAER